MDGPRWRWTPLLVAATVLAILAVPARAFASGSVYLTVPVEASYTQWAGPPLVLNGAGSSPRFLGAAVPSATHLYGGSLALNLDGAVGEDGVGISETLLRLRISSSSSSAPTTEITGFEPITVTRRPETLVEVGFPILGQGLFITHEHFSLRVGLEGGWAYLMSSANVTSASGPGSGTANAGSFYFRTPIAACLLEHPFGAERRILPDGDDVCVTFAPVVYEYGWFEGWSAGIRVDL